MGPIGERNIHKSITVAKFSTQKEQAELRKLLWDEKVIRKDLMPLGEDERPKTRQKTSWAPA